MKNESMSRALALGFFDGVHAAHRAVLKAARDAADTQGCTAAAVTFDLHPAAALKGEAQQLVQTLADRETAICREGRMDECIVLPFAELRNMEAETFVEQILLDRLHAVSVAVGYDYRFGRGGRGDAGLLQHMFAQRGLSCTVVQRMDFDGEPVASCTVRRLIAEGSMERVREILGRPFGFSGEVRHGKSLGHTLGFPTMNVPMPEELVTPPAGVYTALVTIDGVTYRGVCNVDRARLSETFVFDFDRNVYGQSVRVELLSHRRAMKKFEGWDVLARQVESDKAEALAWFAKYQ